VIRSHIARSSKLILILFLITSCGSDSKTPDISNVRTGQKVLRLDQDLFQKELPAHENIPILQRRYGEFYIRFVEDIIRIGKADDSTLAGAWKGFIYDTDIQKIQKAVSSEFTDVDNDLDQLKNAFRFYKYYFPEEHVPNIVTFISGFNYSIAVTDSNLGIGLDMYLGQDFPYYQALRYPVYRRARMDRKFMIADALKGWFQTEFNMNDETDNFLNIIIYQGKLLYLTDLCLPNTPDSVKIGFSSPQMEWCRNNEMNLWGLFVNEKLLYSSIVGEYQRFLSDGPFTSGLDRESPSRTGIWMGWNIVRAFAQNNPEVSPDSLMNIDNPQVILQKSDYKPEL
jgi:hypothetical protein